MNEATIKFRIKEFTWYTPVDFGNGLIARGNYLVNTDSDSMHFGSGKWKYIIERNLPDIQGKRVMDIGCNNGISCIQMARMGAREVIGIDSEETWAKWKEQALFVKEALEWRCHTNYPITYINSNMAHIPELALGHFDVVTALCCIYYLEDIEIASLLAYFKEHVDTIIIQCNTNRKDQTAEVHRRALPVYIEKALKNVGYKYISTDKPFLYERPVVVGSNFPIKKNGCQGKTDKIRNWIRKKF
ncbi:MAG: DUF1698 domain-containing protein [Desulfatiglans sp.]|nr:DUF1698 domain-containing protein [Desulfatiglans sp.]